LDLLSFAAHYMFTSMPSRSDADNAAGRFFERGALIFRRFGSGFRRFGKSR
jgi:hypothetical protein